MGHTLIMEKYIYQHRGNPGKFDKLWDAWLDASGICPGELVQRRHLDIYRDTWGHAWGGMGNSIRNMMG